MLEEGEKPDPKEDLLKLNELQALINETPEDRVEIYKEMSKNREQRRRDGEMRRPKYEVGARKASK